RGKSSGLPRCAGPCRAAPRRSGPPRPAAAFGAPAARRGCGFPGRGCRSAPRARPAQSGGYTAVVWATRCCAAYYRRSKPLPKLRRKPRMRKYFMRLPGKAVVWAKGTKDGQTMAAPGYAFVSLLRPDYALVLPAGLWLLFNQ
nr:hypothetical protein [Tanacetum cinerariifolium]